LEADRNPEREGNGLERVVVPARHVIQRRRKIKGSWKSAKRKGKVERLRKRGALRNGELASAERKEEKRRKKRREKGILTSTLISQ